MVTEGCSVAAVFGPSMIPTVITNLSHEMNLQQLPQSASSRLVEAHYCCSPVFITNGGMRLLFFFTRVL